ncbi:hypothetical protein OAJ98_02180 [Deltaproteobacteria bacterium]|nr:hypothetical protein [Deltaproteobacteria bacterium]
MRKITFITLMMILGMSSVSFGKTYLCETDFSRKIINLSNDKSKWESSDTHFYKMFIVKTVGNEERILSVKPKGWKKNKYLCKDGENRGKDPFEGVGVSIRGDDFLSCRVPYLIKYGGHTSSEFVLDLNVSKPVESDRLKGVQFSLYENYNIGKIYRTQSLLVLTGKCEEL